MSKPGRPLPLEAVERRLKRIYEARRSIDVTDVAQHVANLEGVSRSTILWFAHKHRVSLRHKRNKSGRKMEGAPDDPSLQHIEEEAARIARGKADICPACGYRYMSTVGFAASLGVCKVCYRESLELAETQKHYYHLSDRERELIKRLK